MAYFRRTGPATFEATEHVGGAWEPGTQHIAPALGLLTHAVETDRDRRRPQDPSPLVPARLSFDILGTLPVAGVTVEVEVLRAGRTIELVEATLVHDGRAAVRLRAWLMLPGDTAEVAAGSWRPPMTPPADVERWDATTVWPGGFIESVEVRRDEAEPGRARFWVRSDVPLLDHEPVGPLPHVVRLVDIANGMTPRQPPAVVAFPNLDLTLHLVRQPEPDDAGWVGFDTVVTFGPTGLGLTETALHDGSGSFGRMAQLLTVRPRPLGGTG